MRKLVLAPALTAAALMAAGPAVAAAATVTVGDNFFVRDSGTPKVTVSKGEKVTWVWKGRSLHNVKVTKGPQKFGSSSMTKGSYSKRVKKKGTYTIVCTVHGPADQSMKLVVR